MPSLNDRQKWNARDNRTVESRYWHMRTLLRVADLAQYFQIELIEIINLFVINIICVCRYLLNKIIKMIGHGGCYWGHVEVNWEGKVKWEISWIRGSIFVDLEAWMNIDFFPHSLPFKVRRPMVDPKQTGVPCLQEEGICWRWACVGHRKWEWCRWHNSVDSTELVWNSGRNFSYSEGMCG